MKELGIVELYDKNGKRKLDHFNKKLNSELKVKTEVKKTIRDIEWIEKMEETIPYIDNILRAPNRFIINEEEIVKIELAKRITVDSIKHLAKHTDLIQNIDKKTGDIKPSKILNINKEESFDTYENRLVYTLIQNMRMFIMKRKTSLQLEVNKNDNKDTKNIDYNAKAKINDETIDINIQLSSKVDFDKTSQEANSKELLERIEKIEQKITDLTSSELYKIIDKEHIALVREPIKKTNVILKNTNFQYIMELWNYLRDNFEDKTAEIDKKQDYVDQGELKQLVDETFFLQYLALKTLDEDSTEGTETKESIKGALMEKMIGDMIDIDSNITDNQLKDMIDKKYAIIKYKKIEAVKDIQEVLKKHIDRYLEKVEKV